MVKLKPSVVAGEEKHPAPLARAGCHLRSSASTICFSRLQQTVRSGRNALHAFFLSPSRAVHERVNVCGVP